MILDYTGGSHTLPLPNWLKFGTQVWYACHVFGMPNVTVIIEGLGVHFLGSITNRNTM